MTNDKVSIFYDFKLLTTRSFFHYIVIFLGSSKDIAAPWGGPKRLGDCVAKYVRKVVEERTHSIGSETIKHEVTLLDPLEVFADDGPLAQSGGELKHPHFFFRAGEAPAAMDRLQQIIKEADCYLVVTPEYNHSIPPALTSLMGHFGGSNYACKPSAIVTYSMGPWGGMRAAVALRPFLSELGCLPVSKLTGFPSAGDMFEADGTPKDPTNRMLGQLPAMLAQLEWMALAMKRQRELSGTV